MCTNDSFYGPADRAERLHVLEAVVVQLGGRAMLLPPLEDALELGTWEMVGDSGR